MENNRTTFTLSRRIGSTNYRVNAYFSGTASETIEDKIIRIVKNEAGQTDTACDIMNVPQIGRPA